MCMCGGEGVCTCVCEGSERRGGVRGEEGVQEGGMVCACVWEGG